MKVHYREVIEHDIEINIEAVITTWKKVIAGYTVNDDWPDEEATKDILEDTFFDTLCCPPAHNNYFFRFNEDDNWMNIAEITEYYGTKVADTCENAVAEYLQNWGLLP